MKIIKLNLKEELAKIRIDNLDDLWILSRILQNGDVVGADTSRAIKKDGSDESKRKRVYLKVVLEKIEYQNSTSDLKLLGKIIESPSSDIPNQAHHSLDIELGSQLDIYKRLDRFEIKRLKDAESAGSSKVVICAADYGEAAIAIAKQFGVDYITDINKSLTGKKKETIKEYEKERKEYIIELAKALDEVSETRNIDRVILGGVGFFADAFKKEIDKFPRLKQKIYVCKVSSPGKPGISEMVRNGTLVSIVKNSRMDYETKMIESFFERIAKDQPVAYGPKQVKAAYTQDTIRTLLVSEDYINELRTEKKFDEFEKMMESLENAGEEVVIISSQHESGEQFSKIGIGAILRMK